MCDLNRKYKIVVREEIGRIHCGGVRLGDCLLSMGLCNIGGESRGALGNLLLGVAAVKL